MLTAPMSDGPRPPAWISATLVFVAALLPRGFAQGQIVTVDEAYHWFARAAAFLEAIRAGDPAGTYQIGHPGVTTMWLGAGGLALHQLLAGLGLLAPDDPALQRWLTRLPVAAVASLCVAICWPLLRRLLGRGRARLATLFLIADPFLVAHAQLLHLDALLTSFITVALLAALVAFRFDAPPGHAPTPLSWPALALSGVCTGLALLTKTPSVILLPMVGLIGLAGLLRHGPQDRAAQGREGLRRELLRRWEPAVRCLAPLAGALGVWLAVALAVWFALWPALWADLPGTVGKMLHQIRSEAGAPHGWGNFFWGRTVADPGPWFYPVALAFRTTPWTLLGLLLLPGALLRRDQARVAAALLLAFALAFALAINGSPKKFDRYLLPIFPALDVLAALGWAWLASWLASLRAVRSQEPGARSQESGVRSQESGARSQNSVVGRWPVALVWLAAALALALNLAWYTPYFLSYYNPLVGGGPAAARTLPVGWGEGYEQAAAFVLSQPNGRDRPVAAWFEPVLRRFIDTPVVGLDWVLQPGRVDYAMLYIDQLQRGNVPEATRLLRQRYTPVHTVRIYGIDYAYIYELPQPVAHPREARFGPAIRLRGYDLDTSAIRAAGVLTVTLHWQAQAAPAEDYTMFAHLLSDGGQTVARADVPPGGPRAPTSAWRASRLIDSVQPLPVPADLPAGRYWLALGLYHPSDFARLPLEASPTPGAPDDGADALLLGPFTVP